MFSVDNLYFGVNAYRVHARLFLRAVIDHERSIKHKSLTFVDFLEAIARLADYKCGAMYLSRARGFLSLPIHSLHGV